MSNWSGGVLTTKGQALQAKVDAGKTSMEITKMKIGSGTLADGQTLEELTDLVEAKLNVPISSSTAKDNITTITGVITNTGLSTGFYVRELGVFATDPDEGEILYSITVALAASYLPAEDEVVESNEFNYNIATSNAASVTATIDTSGLVTVGILEKEITELLAGATFTGAINETTVTMASASTMAIGAAAGNSIIVTGTTNITAFDTAQAGTKRTLFFGSALTVTHNATSMILPTGWNTNVFSGDAMEFISLGSGNWRCTNYQQLNHTPQISNFGSVRHYKDLSAYSNSGGTVTGTMKITLPVSWISSMLTIKISGYNHISNQTWEATFSGYLNLGSVTWTAANTILSPTCPFTSVRFGHDGTYCCILLGTTSSSWSYPKIVITDVIAMHSNVHLFSSGWDISLITDETGITVNPTPTPIGYVTTNKSSAIAGSLTLSPTSGIPKLALAGDANGSIEMGDVTGTSTADSVKPFIDWHYAIGSLQDYNVRQVNSRDGGMLFTGTSTNAMEVCCYGVYNSLRHGFMLGSNGSYGYLDYDTSGGSVRLSSLNNTVFGHNTAAAHNSETFTEYMRLNASGYLGIGTHGPVCPCHIMNTRELALRLTRNQITASGGMVGCMALAGGNDTSASADIGYSVMYGMAETATAGSEVGGIAFHTRLGGANSERVRINNTGFRPAASNAYTLGTSGYLWSQVYAATATINTSDRNAKTDIVDLDLGLDFINSLRPVEFKYKVRQNIVTPNQIDTETVEIEPERTEIVIVTPAAYETVEITPATYDEEGNVITEAVTEEKLVTEEVTEEIIIPAVTEERPVYEEVVTPLPGIRSHAGLIAQEVEETLNGKDIGIYTVGEDGSYGLRYEEFVAPLIKAVQELSATVTSQETTIASQATTITTLQDTAASQATTITTMQATLTAMETRMAALEAKAST